MTPKIDRLFGSATRVALLSKLLMDAESAFHIRELSRNLGIPYSVLYREVKNLASLGILTEEKRGKITLVSANRKTPFFAELRSLMVKTAGLAELLRGALDRVVGIRFALVYGSFASGEESARSDVDVLIVGNASEEKVLRAIDQVEGRTGREFNYILWSGDVFKRKVRARHHLLLEISRNPVIMIVGEEDEFRRALKK